MEKVDEKCKKGYNLGYEIAKELNLKTPLFDDSGVKNSSSNAIQAGMIQFLNEIKPSISKNQKEIISVTSRSNKSKERNSNSGPIL